MLPRRFRGLPQRRDPRGHLVLVATTLRARLLGLALLTEVPGDFALCLPGCGSIHTFGMRFPIDATFLDGEGRVLRVELGIGPGRVLHCRGAAEVVERRSSDVSSRRPAPPA